MHGPSRSSLAFVTPSTTAKQRPHHRGFPSSNEALFAPPQSTTQLNVVLPSVVPAAIHRIRNSLFPSASSTPFTAALFLSALALGYVLGRRRRAEPARGTSVSITDFGEEGVAPLWLNYGISKLWKLFQKNTKQFAQETIQPILDDVDKPDFVHDVRIISYNVGKNSPRISNLRPIPARSLAEIQCSYNLHLSSTSDLAFEVDVEVPEKIPFSQKNKTVTVPVELSNLHVDARMWSAFTLAPYEPYCTTWRYSLLETPSVQFDMNLASALPITAVPGLRQWFFQIIRREIPKDFMFPSSNTVDFAPKEMRKKKREFTNITISEIEKLSDDKIKELFPKEWALYHSLDLDESGSLSQEDLTAGLEDWGYSTKDTKEYYEKLDPNNKGAVSFAQFCLMWPNVTASEISQDYEGILSVAVHEGINLTSHDLGFEDPFVEFSLGNETATTAVLKTDEDEDSNSTVFLDDSFELKCTFSKNELLRINVVKDSKLFGRRVLAETTVPLIDFVDQPTKTISVDLEPQGQLNLDLSYGKFVDRWEICWRDDEDDDQLADDKPKKIVKSVESTVLDHEEHGKTTVRSDNKIN